MAAVFNFIDQYQIDQGADWFATVFYKDPDGVAINMTGYTAALQIRSYPQDTTAVLTLTTANGGITINSLLGKINIHATATQTGAIDEGYYVYDLEVTDVLNGGTKTRLAQGQAAINAEVTRV